jgi:hypothetical protein
MLDIVRINPHNISASALPAQTGNVHNARSGSSRGFGDYS